MMILYLPMKEASQMAKRLGMDGGFLILYLLLALEQTKDFYISSLDNRLSEEFVVGF